MGLRAGVGAVKFFHIKLVKLILYGLHFVNGGIVLSKLERASNHTFSILTMYAVDFHLLEVRIPN